jgi:hypothetical protein
MKKTCFSLVLLVAATGLPPAAGLDKADLHVVHRIRSEAFERPQVMDHLFFLTDVHGPRLTASPGFNAAADWAIQRLKEWGCENVKKENWGTFGRGWSLVRFAAHLKEPAYAPIIGFPLAWSPGTDGPVSGEPMLAPIALGESDEELSKDLEKFKGKLRGRIVMIEKPRELAMQGEPLARRYSDSDLASEALAPEPKVDWPFDEPKPKRPWEAMRKRLNRRNQFLKDEGVVLVLMRGYRGDGGTVSQTAAGSRDPKDPAPPPTVAITPEHYNRIARLLNKKIPVRVEFEIETKFHEEPESYNIIAEIPGGRKKDEVVMLGAHFDSWIGGTGATDNGTGSAVMLEAMRILKTLGLKMDRTIRLALWSAEESGLLGSKGYVKEHFADSETMALKPEHDKLAAYFNYDNGSGKIRGVYLQGNDMVRPIFAAWLEPFHDLGARTLTIRNTGGTDHLSFDAVGLPGFQFIQDPLEYGTRTHHSNMDVYDRVQGGDLMQASAIVASFAYHAATREEMLPRKPLPKPKPKEEDKK